MNEQCWGHPRISYSPTVSLLHNFPFILCSVMLDLELSKLYFADSLVSCFLLSSANGRHYRKTVEERRKKGKFFFQFSSFLHLPSNNSRRLAPAPASFSPSSTFLKFLLLLVSGHISRVRLHVPKDRCKVCSREK